VKSLTWQQAKDIANLIRPRLSPEELAKLDAVVQYATECPSIDACDTFCDGMAALVGTAHEDQPAVLEKLRSDMAFIYHYQPA